MYRVKLGRISKVKRKDKTSQWDKQLPQYAPQYFDTEAEAVQYVLEVKVAEADRAKESWRHAEQAVQRFIKKYADVLNSR